MYPCFHGVPLYARYLLAKRVKQAGEIKRCTDKRL